MYNVCHLPGQVHQLQLSHAVTYFPYISMHLKAISFFFFALNSYMYKFGVGIPVLIYLLSTSYLKSFQSCIMHFHLN